MSRVLNLDEFLPEPSKVSFMGTEYTVAPVGVETLFRLISLMEGMDASMAEKEVLDKIMGLLKDVLPDMPEEVIRKLSVIQLFGLINFIVEELQKDPNVQMAMATARKGQ